MEKTTGKKVLLVEDDALLLLSLSRQFEEAGYTVVIAHDGEQGVDAFTQERPMVVVSDVMMPKKDGLDMLKDIRAAFPDDKTPVIFLSNSDDMNHVAGATDAGAVAYLIKSDAQIQNIVKVVEEKLHVS